MCRSATQCAERVADRENLVRELVDALANIVFAWETGGCYKKNEMGIARQLIIRAKDQQGE